MKKNKLKVLSGASLFLVFMGIVSMLSDMTHEGASSISGAYLSLLGASGTAIGFVSGFGTFIGYGLRLLTGIIADKKKNYWLMTILGYTIDLIFIPFLALVPENGWILACGLLLIGKFGNAIKKPAKDTMVSFATSEIGQGKGFAFLEFIDQIGAFVGPTFLFLIMLFTTNLSKFDEYRICFAFLIIPAILCIIFLFISKKKFPHPETYEKKKENISNKSLKKIYILYIVGVCLFGFGFIDFPLVTAFEASKNIVSTNFLPLLYSGAMLIDAFAALFFGLMYDKKGFLSLAISALLSAPFALFIFMTKSLAPLIIGIILWGIGMGAQESIMKSAIATLTSKDNRSKGYGVFQFCFGLAWFLGSTLTGYLFDKSLIFMSIFSFICQLCAVIIFISIYFIRKANNKNINIEE